VRQLGQQLRLSPKIAYLIVSVSWRFFRDAFEGGLFTVNTAEVDLAEGSLSQDPNDFVFADFIDFLIFCSFHSRCI
jgi:hypothetical protein